MREIRTLRSSLVSLEAELAQVRRARSAAGLPRSPKTTTSGIEHGWTADGDLIPTFLQDAGDQLARVGALEAGAYSNLTMKQLTMKALWEHFPNGATTRELLDFFSDAWGREIERTNLSPQLSRLYKEGKIGRIRSIKGWFCIPPNEARGRRLPYRRKETGEIIWMLPSQAGEDVEGLVTRDMHADDPPDDY